MRPQLDSRALFGRSSYGPERLCAGGVSEMADQASAVSCTDGQGQDQDGDQDQSQLPRPGSTVSELCSYVSTMFS